MSLIDAHNGPHPDKRHSPPIAPTPDDVARICWLMETAVAASFAVPVDELRAPSRRVAAAAFARQCTMYVAHVMLRLSFSDTGAVFHRDRTTAAYACQLVEGRRDNPAIDRMLNVLENLCGEIARNIRTLPQVRP